jgi:hypothetical protein
MLIGEMPGISGGAVFLRRGLVVHHALIDRDALLGDLAAPSVVIPGIDDEKVRCRFC